MWPRLKFEREKVTAKKDGELAELRSQLCEVQEAAAGKSLEILRLGDQVHNLGKARRPTCLNLAGSYFKQRVLVISRVLVFFWQKLDFANFEKTRFLTNTRLQPKFELTKI